MSDRDDEMAVCPGCGTPNLEVVAPCRTFHRFALLLDGTLGVEIEDGCLGNLGDPTVVCARCQAQPPFRVVDGRYVLSAG
jgi:hypothetical protein